MVIDLSQQGMGLRCKRFVCVVEGGVVTHTRVGDKVGLVSAATVEKVLEGTKDSAQRNGGLLDKLLGREMESRAAEAATRESEDLLPVRVPYLTWPCMTLQNLAGSSISSWLF